MPNRKLCPYSREWLVAHYEQGRSPAIRSAHFEATGETISETLALRWLRDANVEVQAYSLYAENKIECPFSSDELRKMHDVEVLSCEEIAFRAAKILRRPSICSDVARRWLESAGIERRPTHFARTHPGSPPVVECPFSPDRLRELYWVEGLSLTQLVPVAREALNGRFACNAKIIRRWLAEAGVNQRTASQACKIAANRPDVKEKTRRALSKGWQASHARKGTAPASGYRQIHTPESRRKAVAKIRETMRRKHDEILETRYCNRCQQPITKIPSLFKHPTLAWCSRACATRDMGAARRKKREAVPLQPCRNRRCENLVKSPRRYCSKSCGAIASAARRRRAARKNNRLKSLPGVTCDTLADWLGVGSLRALQIIHEARIPILPGTQKPMRISILDAMRYANLYREWKGDMRRLPFTPILPAGLLEEPAQTEITLLVGSEMKDVLKSLTETDLREAISQYILSKAIP